MSAEVFESTAMVPHERVISGFQAGCADEICGADDDRVHLDGQWVRWCGKFREKWIDAAYDARLHNIEVHGFSYAAKTRSWQEIVHG